MNKWLSTGYLKSKPEGAVDRERGIIPGALVVTEGEAKGHGVFLEAEFVDEVIRQGNEAKAGLKARFGHPNMCSTALGTFLGRWKNFRRDTITRDDGSQAVAARADLFLSQSAKDTPHGDLYEYVLGMAEKEGDMFGTSIVFTPGDGYRKTKSGKKVVRVWERDEKGGLVFNRDGQRLFRWIDENGKDHDPAADPVIERDYAVCQKLHACDAVDDPAANDGLFSRFSQETVAGQVTEFLDLHPEVFNAVADHPEILEALANYGNRVDEFIQRYQEYKKQKNGETNMESNDTPGAETPETPPAAEPEGTASTTETTEPETTPETQPETPPAAAPESAPPEPPPDPETPPPPATEQQSDESRAEFKRMCADFGQEIAAQVFADGGGYDAAREAYYKAIEAENKALKAKVAALPSGGTPAAFVVGDKPTDVDENGVHRLFRQGTRRNR